MVTRVWGVDGKCRWWMAALVVLAFVLPMASSQAAPAQNRSKKPVAAKSVKQSGQSVKRRTASSSQRKKSTLAKNARKSPNRQVARRGTSSSKVAVNRNHIVRASIAPRQTVGERMGLRGADDPLDLSSSVALVVDQDTSEVLFSKNDEAVLPIASLTKLMTGLVIADAQLPMDETITITSADIDTYKGSRSRLAVGTRLTRAELMHLALMSSENRAAHALGRTFPGGMDVFVQRMNTKARELGMYDTRYVEPTGLLSQNQSSARDLATLVSVAYERPMLRELSTSPGYELSVGRRVVQYRNSNRLVLNPDWEIGLQKTGYISEAGRCLVMQTSVSGRNLIMVFLDAAGKVSRMRDAERVRRWVEAQGHPMVQTVSDRPQG